MGVASAGCHSRVMKYMTLYVIMYNAKGLAGDKMKYVLSRPHQIDYMFLGRNLLKTPGRQAKKEKKNESHYRFTS